MMQRIVVMRNGYDKVKCSEKIHDGRHQLRQETGQGIEVAFAVGALSGNFTVFEPAAFVGMNREQRFLAAACRACGASAAAAQVFARPAPHQRPSPSRNLYMLFRAAGRPSTEVLRKARKCNEKNVGGHSGTRSALFRSDWAGFTGASSVTDKPI
jgi:hypothetical protein